MSRRGVADPTSPCSLTCLGPEPLRWRCRGRSSPVEQEAPPCRREASSGLDGRDSPRPRRAQSAPTPARPKGEGPGTSPGVGPGAASPLTWFQSVGSGVPALRLVRSALSPSQGPRAQQVVTGRAETELRSRSHRWLSWRVPTSRLASRFDPSGRRRLRPVPERNLLAVAADLAPCASSRRRAWFPTRIRATP